jgi:lambda family phage portal protein
MATFVNRLTHWFDRFTGAERRAKRQIVNRLAESGQFSRAERLARRLDVDPPESLRRWESARMTRLNQAHWTPVSGQPINAELAAWLNNLRQRTEFEIANNSLVEGMIQTYQLCVVGSEGPRLSVLSQDREYAAKRRELWAEWSQTAGSNQQLSLVEILDQWIRALFGGGEFFDQLVSVSDVEGPLKTRLLPIHTHRLMTPPEMLGDPAVALGVRRDLTHRRPLSYYISQPFIFGAYEVYTGEFLEIPYADALHGFRMVEEDQVRGFPWLASCLDPIAEIRDFKTETLDAARAAADQAVVLWTQSPDIPALQTNETTDIERRTIKTMPPGWQPTMVNPAHPGPQYEAFYESLAREIGGPICMPLMMLLLDSSGHNYSSARFDGQLFWRGVAKTQGWLGRLLLRVEAILALEAELAGELPPPPNDLVRRLIWPLAPHVDPTKEATAEHMYLENGTMTYSEACAARGKSVEEVIAERQRDDELLANADLPTVQEMLAGGGNESQTTEVAGDGEVSTKQKTKTEPKKPRPGNSSKRASSQFGEVRRDWVTLDSGAHVYIDDSGTISKGPAGLVGGKASDLKNAYQASAKAHAADVAARPQGVNGSAEQHAQAAKALRDAQQAHKEAAAAHLAVNAPQSIADASVHKYNALQAKHMAIYHEKIAKEKRKQERDKSKTGE